MMPDPRERVFAAIERARFAVGNVAPLTELERAQVDDCLTRLAVPRAKGENHDAGI